MTLILAGYVVLGVTVALEARHAIPGARLTNVIMVGVMWPLAVFWWLSAVIRDWHSEWKENGKHW